MEEVKARTKDALTPLRALQVGKYSNTVQDLVLPWSLRRRLGVHPAGVREFFLEKLPTTAMFPYEEYTTQFPPSQPGVPALLHADQPDGHRQLRQELERGTPGGMRSCPSRSGWAQAGVDPAVPDRCLRQERACAAGAVPRLGVRNQRGRSPPRCPGSPTTRTVHRSSSGPTTLTPCYDAGQRNPFFENAWEQYTEDGTPFESDDYLTAEGSRAGDRLGELLRASWLLPRTVLPWCRAYRDAGGHHHLELGPELRPNLDMLIPENNAIEEYSGMLFVMIYCDEQLDDPVYFLGRFLPNPEPGSRGDGWQLH